MTADEAIALLLSDIHLLNMSATSHAFESWLDNTLVHIGKIFGIASTEALNFETLRGDFRVRKIGTKDVEYVGIISNFSRRAEEQLKGLIDNIQYDKITLENKRKRDEKIRLQEEERALTAGKGLQTRKMEKMSIDDHLTLIKQHKAKLFSEKSYLLGWLEIAHELLSNYLGNDSDQTNFPLLLKKELKESETKKLSEQEEIKMLVFHRAGKQFDNIILELENRIRQRDESANKAIQEIQKKSKVNPQDKKHYTIGISIFWTVLPLLVGAIWTFGYYIGTSKFDKEKVDYYQQTITDAQAIKLKSDTIEMKKDSIRALTKSLLKEK